MRKRRVVIIAGTRPEAIKLAPVYLAINREEAEVLLLATAQHRQMLDQVLSVFGIVPNIDLDIMRPDQTLSELTASLIRGIYKVLAELAPDIVLVQGDTTTCFSGALAAFYARIPIGHVEAGLRTYNLNAPWPEEMNRRLVDPLSRWCFAPTERSAENLREERIPPENIFVTGNTVIDALLLARDISRKKEPIIPGLDTRVLDGKQLILVTGHRRESFGEPFREFCLALRDIVRTHPNTLLVYPVHLNPNVQRPVYEILAGEDRIHLISPVEYLPFVYLMDRSYLIITDSGGIQEEAPSLRKPVLVTREVTERMETVEAGLARLVGTDRKGIFEAATQVLNDRDLYRRMSTGENPYGDGQASQRIARILNE
ncbi:MAG: UDP-N-acetylglucosamine 2-epimerase [Deltaproteobacteria bacterium RBG_16_50_11]|nr:MAG: UDP-N-acetylglucosamine 2-epimerase [Deltaproteobacteria bacterium RBG_16_50_11]